MKILIVGEFSAFANYLSQGFRAIGHDSFVISWGDKGVKQTGESYEVNDKNFIICKKMIHGSHYLRFAGFKLNRFLNKLSSDWDCIIILNLGFIKQTNNPFVPLPSLKQLQRLLKNPNNLFLSAAGGDYIFSKYYAKRKKKVQFLEDKFSKHLLQEEREFNQLSPFIRGVIPISLDYTEAYLYYRDICPFKLLPTIQLPFDVNGIDFCTEIKGKIVIMHGITRSIEKGSDIIIQALDEIRKRHPEKVEVLILKNVPFAEYIKIMKRTNILLDQCYSYGYGMNALEALAMGKVVFSGNEDGLNEEYGIEKSPVINLIADKQYIVERLEELINNPSKIESLAKKGRDYAMRYHDCPVVAARYVNILEKEIL